MLRPWFGCSKRAGRVLISIQPSHLGAWVLDSATWLGPGARLVFGGLYKRNRQAAAPRARRPYPQQPVYSPGYHIIAQPRPMATDHAARELVHQPHGGQASDGLGLGLRSAGAGGGGWELGAPKAK
jgi:hypothetical protein